MNKRNTAARIVRPILSLLVLLATLLPLQAAGTMSAVAGSHPVVSAASNDAPALLPAAQAPLNVILNTGTTDGVPDPFGAVDPNWIVTQAPVPVSGQAFSVQPPAAWVQSSNANWIDPFNTGDLTSDARGLYTYQRQFTIDTTTHTNFALTFQFAADNAATIFLNDTQIASHFSFTTLSGPFTVTGPFQNGVNTLTVDVTNVSGPTGLLVIGTLTADCICTPPPPDMVAWWPLDEGTGTSTADIVSGNTGTLTNGPTWLLGQYVANSLTFGQSNYVQGANHPNFGTGDFSIDAWVRTTPNPINQQVIVDKETKTGGYRRGYRLSLAKSKRIHLMLADGSAKHSSCGPDPLKWPCSVWSSKVIPNLFDGGWHHIAVTVDRDGQLVFYHNGTPAGTADPTNRQGSLDNDAPFRIGSNSYDNSLLTFNGSIDEVELFDRVLGQPEIQAIFDAGTVGKCK